MRLPYTYFPDVPPVKQIKFMAVFLLFVRLMLSRLPNKNRFSRFLLSLWNFFFGVLQKLFLLWIASADFSEDTNIASFSFFCERIF